jgi:hypothetical protein
MKELRNILLLTLACLAIATVSAQDETPGTTVTYQLNTTFCGSTGGSIYGFPAVNCYGIQFALPGQPAGSGGSTWVYTSAKYANPPGAYVPYGWGFFFGNSDLIGQQYTITSSSNVVPIGFKAHTGFPTNYICNGNCTTFTANISGTTPDDGGSYNATLTATLFYYYACGSGRGGGGCGTHAIILASQPGDGTGLTVRYN